LLLLLRHQARSSKSTRAKHGVSLLAAISHPVAIDPKKVRSIDLIKKFSAASIIEVANTAAKAANVTLLRVHLVMAPGGKEFRCILGVVSRLGVRYAHLSSTPHVEYTNESQRPP
jgi:hypothetical protein